MKKFLLLAGLAFFSLENQAQTVTDYDNNVYNTVQIGTQIWMGQNLRTKHYSDGSAITDGTGAGVIWNDFTTKYWFVYGDTAVLTHYGALYTWAAVMNGAASSNAIPSGVQGVCPADWHLPSQAEWQVLIDYLGGNDIAGGKLKDTLNWGSSNVGATNETGFTAVPGGYRNPGGLFQYHDGSNMFNYLWSSTESTTTGDALAEGLYWYWAGMDTSVVLHKEGGVSVRCLKNGGVGIQQNNKLPEFKVYPNPSSDFISVKIQEQTNDYTYTLYNSIGKQVMNGKLTGTTTTLDIRNLPQGIYLLKISSVQGIYQQKLLKE